MYLKFESVSRPVLLAQGLKLLPHLAKLFAKWPFREVPGAGYGDPAINVLQDSDGGVIQAPWIEPEQRYNNAADLAVSLSHHMTRCWMEECADLVGITAAAARFGNDLAVFVGGPQSGKSLLVSCLSVSGHTVFADSILPISTATRQGIGLGIAPRLSLPLPDMFSGPLRTHVERCVDRCGPDLGYLRPHEADMAAFGDRASIGAFILLDRVNDSATALRPAAASTLLKRLLLGSFDALPSTRTTLALLHEMVTDTPCYRLTWSDPLEAVSALRARLAIRRPPEADNDCRTGGRITALRRRASGPRTPVGRRFRRVDGLDERMVDGDMFLVDPGGEAIYHLNGLGTGLWRLLDGSYGLDDAVSVLGEAFPTVERTSIEGDVARLIADLTDRGLLVEQPGEAG
ncbi:MAG: PqqD family protein [Alphaproteobacteria bacterium]|nr:PqqD family protein [Alphaproteobacteria bacterium]